MVHAVENLSHALRGCSCKQVLGAANRYFILVSFEFLHGLNNKSFQWHWTKGAGRRRRASAKFGRHVRRNEFDDFNFRVFQLATQGKRERVDRGLRGAVNGENGER